MRSIGHFIGGKEVKGTSGRTADVFEPMTGDVQAKVALASKPNYANRCLSLLGQVFDYALEQQLVDSNPVVGIKRHTEAKRKRLLTTAYNCASSNAPLFYLLP